MGFTGDCRFDENMNVYFVTFGALADYCTGCCFRVEHVGNKETSLGFICIVPAVSLQRTLALLQLDNPIRIGSEPTIDYDDEEARGPF